MAYSLRGSDGLRGSGRGSSLRDSGGNVDPMASVANIVDAMLVLALGLIIALVTLMKVDVATMEEIIKENQLAEVDASTMAQDMQSEGSSYTELGTVYQDPVTGKLYMLTEDVDKGASAAEGEKGE